MTDVVGSTVRWQSEPGAMDAAMRWHHEIVHAAVQKHEGWRPPDQGEGDAVFAAFRSATDAVAAVLELQGALAAEDWPTAEPLRVRVGVHAGEVIVRDGNLFGDPVNRCARIRGLAAGGQSLLSAAVADAVRVWLPAGVTLSDLGEHRMKDLAQPVRIFQLDDGEPTDFPPLRGLATRTHNLPIAATSLVGRREEIAQLVELIGSHRLVTVTGFGGMGKTRLALQVAAELTDVPLGGQVLDVWFVDLSAVRDPELVPARVAEAAGVTWTEQGPAQALADAMRERPALLVLDNLEQVLGCAPAVAQLLASAPTVRILTTSREPLHISGEQQYPLAPLPLPAAAGVGPDDVEQAAGTRLFVDRAKEVKPSFAVTADNAPVIAEICARLDGHPLALELAAARLKILPPAVLLTRLEGALSLLTGGSRDAPLRQQTLRATIAWSVDLLTADERALLDALSVLPAPADLELIEALTPDGLDGFTLLEALVDKSLVAVTETDDAEPRYGLLVPVREYLDQQLDDTHRSALRDRHARHVADRLHALSLFFRDEEERFAYVATQLPHLRSAIEHLQRTGDAATEVQLVHDLDDTLCDQGHLLEHLALLDRALTITTVPGLRRDLHRNRALVFHFLGRDGFVREWGWAVEEARRAGDVFPLAWLLSAYSTHLTSLAAFDAALTEFDDLTTRLPADLPIEERTHLVSQRTHAVTIALAFADPVRAEEAARQQLDAASDADSQATARMNLSQLLLAQNRLGEAAAVLSLYDGPDLAVSSQGMRHTIAYRRAELALALGNLDSAVDLATPVYEQEWQDGGFPSRAVAVLADVRRREGDLIGALTLVDRCLTRDTGSSYVAYLLTRRATLLRELDRADEGLPDLQRHVDLFADDPFERRKPFTLAALAELAARAADIDPALAARLLGCLAEHCGPWAIPTGLDATVKHLENELLPTHATDYELGRKREQGALAREALAVLQAAAS